MSKRKWNIRNSLIYYDYYSRLKNIALSVFKWEGLPESCSERFLEDTLFHYGDAVFVDDPNLGFLNLKVTPASTLNPYNESTSYTAYSTGYSRIFPANECVYIRNNYMAKSTDSTIMIYAERLAEIQLTMNVNVNAQKTPIIIRCDKNSEFSIKQMYSQYEDNAHKIYVSKSLENPLEVLNTSAPFITDKLRDEKRAVWNEALEFLGINTNPSDKKKERLIMSEVDSNNEQIDIQAETMLLCRQKACEDINKKYGLNVSVSRRVTEKPVQEVGDE